MARNKKAPNVWVREFAERADKLSPSELKSRLSSAKGGRNGGGADDGPQNGDFNVDFSADFFITNSN